MSALEGGGAVNPRRWAFGLLALCFGCYAAARGMQESYAIFLLPLSNAFGWTRGEVSSVYSFNFVIIGLAGPLVGMLCDRWGPVRVIMTAMATAACAALLSSFASALWHFYLSAGVMMGFAVACASSVPMTSLLSRWYRSRLNTALAVAHSASGAGIMVFGPLAQALIDAAGWRGAYLILAAGLACIVPVFFLIRSATALAGHPDYRATPPHGERGGGARAPATGLTLAGALATAPFWGMAATYFSTSVAMFIVVLQTPAFLVEAGYTPQQAAAAFGAIGVMLPAGMIGFGWLGDRIGRTRAVLISYSLTILGVLTLFALSHVRSVLLLGLFVACFGGTFGSRSPALSTVAALVFRGAQFGRIFGTIMIAMGLGGGLGAWLGGALYDFTGGYDTGLFVSLVFLVLGAAPFVLVAELKGK